MNKLSKEKRDQLILVGIGTVAVCLGIWFGVIRSQNKSLAQAQNKAKDVRDKIDKANKALQGASQVEADLEKATKQLKDIEQSMTSGDMYSWAITTVNNFIQANQKIDISTISAPVQGEVGILPKFPYKAATFTLTKASAFFTDFGRFVADFENTFPYMRVQNLELMPSATPEEKEKLDIKFEIVALINGAEK